ncbi:PEP-CTERM sorting domain-containing protein [Oxalobacteraceae bacterium OTU3CINTB1]|nr:PEP-CTERM sorting domain-containing protein [Oxalobacteraceae bacterium OTU3CINTB1]
MFNSLKKMAVITVLGFVAGTAQAALVTYSSTGILYDGYDGLNIFGVGENLKGQTFTQTMTLDLDGFQDIVQEEGLDWRHDTSHNFIGSVTVGNVTYSWKGISATADVTIRNSLTLGKPNGYDWLSMDTWGKNQLNPGDNIDASTSISSYSKQFMPDSDFLNPRAFGGELSNLFTESHFAVNRQGNLGGQTHFLGRVTSASWTVDQSVSPVPEPGTYGMFMIGMGFVGLVLRRRAMANV